MTEIHNYDADTGTYLGTTKARLDPLEGKPMVPANATLVAPPKSGAQKVAVWGGDGWSLEPDYRGTEYWLADGSRHFITEIGDEPPEEALEAAPPCPRAEQREMALARIDAIHAEYLRTLTGGATIEERDTWKSKEEAARAFVADTATNGQSAMIAAEAVGAGVTDAAMAAKVIAKADAFLSLIGVAAGLRAKTRAAITRATDDAIPLENVSAAVEQVFLEMKSEVQAAVAAFHG